MIETVQQRLRKWLVCLLLALVTLAAYAPLAGNNFINFDDPDYVMNNPPVRQGLSWSAVKWAFLSFHSSNWHPLTWLSHMLDCQLYGLNPAGHHLTSLVFHLANTVLLFLFLQNVTARLWPSAFVALLFAIHPMHVESVAWVAERKDVLSGFFFLLTLLAYARYVELAQVPGRRCWMVYGLTLLLFALGLMAKPMLVTLPCVLCLLDYWPLNRFQLPLKSQPPAVLRRLALEKIPFFILAALSGWITFLAQAQGDSVVPVEAFPIEDRLAHVPVAYAWYVFKFIWPANLSVFYMLNISHAFTTVAGALLLFLIITSFAVWRVRQPYLLVGWLWFVGMLVPVLGLIQVGNQAHANRYSYLPYIGLFIMFAWGVSDLLAKWRHRQPALWIATLVIAAACLKLTTAQIHFWKNGPLLYQRAIDLDADNGEAWFLLGLQFMNDGNIDQAIACMRRATTIYPLYHQAWNDLGRFLFIKGDFAGAEKAYQTALLYAPDKVIIYNNLGDLFIKTGRIEEAIVNYQRSLELAPNQAETCKNLGLALVLNHEPDRAMPQFQNALRLDPTLADAALNLAIIYDDQGQTAQAIDLYRQTLALAPDSVIALNNLAWLLAAAADPQLRNGAEAVRLAEHACKLSQYQKAFFIGTLADAYAEAGRFHDAVAAAQKARAVALAQGQKEIADKNAQLLELYQSGRAFHLAAPSAR